MKKILYFFLLLFFFFPLSATAADFDVAERDDAAGRFLADYTATFYNTGFNNFPSDEANAVLQTQDGFLWFGGYNGLFRYDGARFTIWDSVSPDGFGSSNIRVLHESADGVLWVGTNDRGIAVYRDGDFTVYNRSHGLPSNTVRAIAESADGTIYGGTQEGLFRINCDGDITAIDLGITAHRAVYSLCADEHGHIFIVLGNEEMYIYTPDGRTLRVPTDIRAQTVRRVSGGRIVVGTRSGEVLILRFDGQIFTRFDEIMTPLINISAVYEDANGFIWLAGENGLGFLDGDEVYRNVGNPGGSGFFSGIVQDYQQGYWITSTRSGVVHLSVSAFSDFNAMHRFQTGAVNAFLMHGGKTYIGTNNGLFILDESGRPADTAISARVTGRVRGLHTDSAGHIWISTYSDLGVIRYAPATGDFQYWTPEHGMQTDRTRLIQELPNGAIAVGTATGVNFIMGDAVVSANAAFETNGDIILPDIMVLSMVYANDTLYLGTDGNGVFAVNANGTVRFSEEDGLTGGVVLRMMAGENGVWATASPGLNFIDWQGQVHVIEKIPPYTFFDILPLGDDIILLTSNNIIRTNAADLLDPNAPFIFESVGRTSGLNAQINANAWNVLTPDGELFFCTDRGISIYRFGYSASAFIPFAGVASIDIDGAGHRNINDRVVLPHDANRLTFRLSFLSFSFIHDAVLRYKLVGQDEAPITLARTDNHEISYTNLRGGDYALHVWTEDSHGNIGNFIEIELFKELRLFELAYVWILLIALIAAAIALFTIGIVRFRTRALTQKQREYRTIIYQALTAITHAIDAKDPYTSGHSSRVAAYSAAIARRLGMDRGFIENLYYIGLMHDVGKIGIPNEIINKPDKLTDEEYAVMKNHPLIGYDILKEITAIQNLSAGAAEHHERWDGKGYARQIEGENISLEARIIAAADTYDAMSSDRSYRRSLSKEAIYAEFKKNAGTQFDRQIAEIVMEMIQDGGFEGINVGEIIGLA